MTKKIFTLIIILSIVALIYITSEGEGFSPDEIIFEDTIGHKGENFEIKDLDIKIDNNNVIRGHGDLICFLQTDDVSGLTSFKMKIFVRSGNEEIEIFDSSADSSAPMYYINQHNPFKFETKVNSDLKYKDLEFRIQIMYQKSKEDEKIGLNNTLQ